MNTVMRPSLPRSLPFAWQFVADYRRNPVNLLLLVLVPITFAVVAAPSMANAAEPLSGPGGPMVETNTAGWAAGFLAGIAMYFQVASAREVDRRLVLSGLPAWRIVSARLLTGFTLAFSIARSATSA